MKNIKPYLTHILVVFAALGALLVAYTGNDTAKMACFASPKCKAAYDMGATADEVSATTAGVTTAQ